MMNEACAQLGTCSALVALAECRGPSGEPDRALTMLDLSRQQPRLPFSRFPDWAACVELSDAPGRGDDAADCQVLRMTRQGPALIPGATVVAPASPSL